MRNLRGPLAFLLLALPLGAQTDLISANGAGAPGNGDSWRPDISTDGRWVVFASTASDLVASDTNGMSDAFVRDRVNGSTFRASVGPGGVEANGMTILPKISPDGRWVGFNSLASNLVAGDANNAFDAFVLDQSNGQLIRASEALGGGDADKASYVQAISLDGRFVIFSSLATNLIVGDQNQVRDLFELDRQSGVTTRIVLGLGGVETNGATVRAALNADARYCAFESLSNNLVAGDTNGAMDVFVLDRQTGAITRESVGPGGIEGNDDNDGPAISGDGRYVGFASYSTNVWPNDTNNSSDVFIRDRLTGAIDLASRSLGGGVPDLDSHLPGLSFDGRYVCFNSMATDVVSGDTNGVGDVFVIDRLTQITTRVTVGPNGEQGDGLSIFPVMTRTGDEVVFESSSSTFAAGDANALRDVFVRKSFAACEPIERYCTAKLASAGCAPSIDWSGWPSVANPAPFDLRASDVLNNKFGLLIYSTSGEQAVSFGGGTLCIVPPLRRTTVQPSGGSASGTDCTGTFTFDFNAHAASGVDPALVAGAAVWAQYWSRDNGFAPPNNVSLTDALRFELCD